MICASAARTGSDTPIAATAISVAMRRNSMTAF
jgi:hypothetical protein